jgi:hypothetical protein
MNNQEITDLPHFSGNGHSAQGKRVNPDLWPVYKLAEAHCANWCKGGFCKGADVDLKTGRHFRWQRAGCSCLLAVGQRCPYFEESVLPMEKRSERDWPSFAMGDAFRKVARLYHEAFPETVAIQSENRKCPDCGKGSVEPKKQFCAKCRIRRRRAANATNQRNWRKQAAHRNTKDEIGSGLGAASRGANSNTRYPLSGNPVLGTQLYYGKEAKLQ